MLHRGYGEGAPNVHKLGAMLVHGSWQLYSVDELNENRKRPGERRRRGAQRRKSGEGGSQEILDRAKADPLVIIKSYPNLISSNGICSTLENL